MSGQANAPSGPGQGQQEPTERVATEQLELKQRQYGQRGLRRQRPQQVESSPGAPGAEAAPSGSTLQDTPPPKRMAGLLGKPAQRVQPLSELLKVRLAPSPAAASPNQVPEPMSGLQAGTTPVSGWGRLLGSPTAEQLRRRMQAAAKHSPRAALPGQGLQYFSESLEVGSEPSPAAPLPGQAAGFLDKSLEGTTLSRGWSAPLGRQQRTLGTLLPSSRSRAITKPSPADARPKQVSERSAQVDMLLHSKAAAAGPSSAAAVSHQGVQCFPESLHKDAPAPDRAVSPVHNNIDSDMPAAAPPSSPMAAVSYGQRLQQAWQRAYERCTSSRVEPLQSTALTLAEKALAAHDVAQGTTQWKSLQGLLEPWAAPQARRSAYSIRKLAAQNEPASELLNSLLSTMDNLQKSYHPFLQLESASYMGYGLLAVLQRSRAERVQHGLHEDRAAPPEGGHAFGEEAGASGRQGHLSPTRQQPVRHTRQQAAQPESPTAAMEVTMAVLRSPDLKQYPQVHESLWDVHEGTTFSRQSLPDGAGASLGFRVAQTPTPLLESLQHAVRQGGIAVAVVKEHGRELQVHSVRVLQTLNSSATVTVKNPSSILEELATGGAPLGTLALRPLGQLSSFPLLAAAGGPGAGPQLAAASGDDLRRRAGEILLQFDTAQPQQATPWQSGGSAALWSKDYEPFTLFSKSKGLFMLVPQGAGRLHSDLVTFTERGQPGGGGARQVGLLLLNPGGEAIRHEPDGAVRVNGRSRLVKAPREFGEAANAAACTGGGQGHYDMAFKMLCEGESGLLVMMPTPSALEELENMSAEMSAFYLGLQLAADGRNACTEAAAAAERSRGVFTSTALQLRLRAFGPLGLKGAGAGVNHIFNIGKGNTEFLRAFEEGGAPVLLAPGAAPEDPAAWGQLQLTATAASSYSRPPALGGGPLVAALRTEVQRQAGVSGSWEDAVRIPVVEPRPRSSRRGQKAPEQAAGEAGAGAQADTNRAKVMEKAQQLFWVFRLLQRPSQPPEPAPKLLAVIGAGSTEGAAEEAAKNALLPVQKAAAAGRLLV